MLNARSIFLFCSEHCLLAKRAVSLVACFLKASDSASSGPMAGEAGCQVLRQIGSVLMWWVRVSLPCPVSPGLWRRAGWRKPLRDVRRNWDGQRASIWRNHAPHARWRLQHGPTQNGHDLWSDLWPFFVGPCWRRAMTYDQRSEQTWIDDRPLRRQVRAENARKGRGGERKDHLCWIFAFSSSTFSTFSARTWRLRGLVEEENAKIQRRFLE